MIREQPVGEAALRLPSIVVLVVGTKDVSLNCCLIQQHNPGCEQARTMLP